MSPETFTLVLTTLMHATYPAHLILDFFIELYLMKNTNYEAPHCIILFIVRLLIFLSKRKQINLNDISISTFLNRYHVECLTY
jgi:hypothetical protein